MLRLKEYDDGKPRPGLRSLERVTEIVRFQESETGVAAQCGVCRDIRKQLDGLDTAVSGWQQNCASC